MGDQTGEHVRGAEELDGFWGKQKHSGETQSQAELGDPIHLEKDLLGTYGKAG